ncbi:MAG: hypothetical protein VB015_01200 [Erysipelotrichaceae bacterium]|nr:hypothetical protein [Erysipelotrichaceae bacterium]
MKENPGQTRKITIITVSISLLSLVAIAVSVVFSILTIKEEYFTITWKNYNGSILEVNRQVKKNTLPSYNGTPPIRDRDSTHIYTFDGWDPVIKIATENQTYTAVYKISSVV